MPFLIGTDEAGYGPNLGPLVVSGTLWSVADPQRELFDELGQWLIAQPNKEDANRIVIGDSKSVYQQGADIGPLERSVLTMSRVAGLQAESFHEFARQLCGLSDGDLQRQKSYDWNCLQIPLAGDMREIRELANSISPEFDARQIQLAKIQCAAVFAEEFNGALHHCDNKATLLSTCTCMLIRQLLEEASKQDSAAEVLILCDKHGGRSHYGALLQHHLTDQFVEVVAESRELSVYRWKESGRSIEVRFIVKGECRLPIALASMTAKYFRELAMKAWNSFWQIHLPAIRPTAGYPLDAKRFKREIADRQLALGIQDQSIWRRK